MRDECEPTPELFYGWDVRRAVIPPPTDEVVVCRTKKVVTKMIESMQPGDVITLERHNPRALPDSRMFTLTVSLRDG